MSRSNYRYRSRSIRTTRTKRKLASSTKSSASANSMLSRISSQYPICRDKLSLSLSTASNLFWFWRETSYNKSLTRSKLISATAKINSTMPIPILPPIQVQVQM